MSYPVFIVTKSDLVLRDKDVLSSLAKKNLVAVNITVTPLEPLTLSRVEPYAPTNERRYKAMKELSKAGVPYSVYLSPIFPSLSEPLLESVVSRASECGARCCSAIFLKIRPIVWKFVSAFLKSDFPLLVKKYDELYFKHGDEDLSGYKLPAYEYRRKMMEEIAETCRKNQLKFTSEEFLDLWTTPYSDCVDIDCWHAPTAYSV